MVVAEHSAAEPVDWTVEHSFGCSYYSFVVVVEYFAAVAAVVQFVVDYLLVIAHCKTLKRHNLDLGQAAFVGLDIVDFGLAAGEVVDFGLAVALKIVVDFELAAELAVDFGLAAE